jgi:hypothetical protein
LGRLTASVNIFCNHEPVERLQALRAETAQGRAGTPFVASATALVEVRQTLVFAAPPELKVEQSLVGVSDASCF